MPLLPGAEPFAADGGRVGVLLCHGFTGTPDSVRPWAAHLAAAGCTVRAPRLPGHGTRWQDANDTGWPDWFAEVERSFAELAGRCDVVFAGGLSMGGTLTTRLAEVTGNALAGLILVNPSYATERRDAKLARYVSWAVRSRPSIGGDIKKGVNEPTYDRTPVRAFVSLQKLWAVTRADFDKITVPVLLFRSRVDHVVEALSGRLLQSGATSTTVREVILEDSYHVATLDNDAPIIFEQSLDFIRERLPDHVRTLT